MERDRENGRRSILKPGIAASRSRLARLKAQIASGEYETPAKLEKALRNLLGDLRGPATPAGLSREDGSDDERP